MEDTPLFTLSLDYVQHVTVLQKILINVDGMTS